MRARGMSCWYDRSSVEERWRDSASEILRSLAVMRALSCGS